MREKISLISEKKDHFWYRRDTMYLYRDKVEYRKGRNLKATRTGAQ